MRFSDEAVLAALIQNGSIRKASRSLNCSETLIRERLKRADFAKKFREVKDGILSDACSTLQTRLSVAIDTITAVMINAESPPQVKLNAADSLLRNCIRYTETVDILRRLSALEKQDKEGKQ